MMAVDRCLSHELQMFFPVCHLSLVLPWRDVLCEVKLVIISFLGFWNT